MAVSRQVAVQEVMTPANVVTVGRIVLSPVVILGIYWLAPDWWVAVATGALILTDRLDGLLARKYGSSELGAFLDPLADKVIVLGSFIALVLLGIIWWVPVAVIALREIAMSSWRSHLAKHGVSVPARRLAKWKMGSQSVAIVLALIPGIHADHHWVLSVMVWVSVLLTLVTFMQYVLDGAKSTRQLETDD